MKTKNVWYGSKPEDRLIVSPLNKIIYGKSLDDYRRLQWYWTALSQALLNAGGTGDD